MPTPSKVIVVQRDRRLQEAMRLGFEREGAAVVAAESVEAAQDSLGDDVELVVAGADEPGAAASLLAALVGATEDAGCDAPVLYVGNGVARDEAWALGASEVLEPPAYLRDVVTVGKLLAASRGRAILQGDLGDTFGVFYLIRALAATHRSGVLFMSRGLRRGEVRFYVGDGDGEVTSAAVGALHGQAALHQLLLWTEARFEFRHEPVVRRRQIPLDHAAMLADAERFLLDIREVAGGLSPSAVFEQDVQKIQALAKKIPTEVHGVLRLFDGNRTVADVLEDGPYRLFETLRVAQRAIEAGLLRRVETAKPKAAQRAVLAVEEWLIGADSKEAVRARIKPTGDTGPVPTTVPEEASSGAIASGAVGSKRRRKRKRARARARSAGETRSGAGAPAEIDWGALVPRSTGVEMSSLSGVVPATMASGEIAVSRQEEREGLEALTDAEQRDRLFPAESVTVDESIARAEEEERQRVVAELEAKAAAEKAAAEAAKAAAAAAAKAAAEQAAAEQARAKRAAAEEAGAKRAAAVKAAAVKAAAEQDAAKAAAAQAAAAKAAAERAAAEKEAEKQAEAGRAAAAKAAASQAAAEARADATRTFEKEPAADETDKVERTEPEAASASADAADATRSFEKEPGPDETDKVERTEPEVAVHGTVPVDSSGEIRNAPTADRSVDAGPSILIDDLAAAHAAASAAAGKNRRKREPTPPPVGDEVARIRADAAAVTEHATHFTDDEVAFFQEAEHPEFAHGPKAETFHDLDEGYQPQSFWDRLLGRKPVRRGGGGGGKPGKR